MGPANIDCGNLQLSALLGIHLVFDEVADLVHDASATHPSIQFKFKNGRSGKK